MAKTTEQSLAHQLYFVATPIGNLADITVRALYILRIVDFIAAEDTRHSKKLLKHYEIITPLISFHKFNEQRTSEKIIDRIQEGERCAVISDAGLPGVSDPGFRLIEAARAHNIAYTVIPGPTAVSTALVLSGFLDKPYTFKGFLPTRHMQRQKKLRSMAGGEDILIFFESPNRVVACLKDIEKICGNCQVAVVREMTKIHEQVIRGPIATVVDHCRKHPLKGEMVIVLDPTSTQKTAPEVSIDQDIQKLQSIFPHLTRTQAVKAISVIHGVNKRALYKKAVKQ